MKGPINGTVLGSRFAFVIAGLSLLSLATAPAVAQDAAGRAYQRAYDLVLSEKWTEARAALTDFLRQHKTNAWVDDAQFWLCYVDEQRGQPREQVFDCYNTFVKANPRSEWNDDAKANLVRVGQRLVQEGKQEYEAIIRSMQESANDEVRLAALDALWQMGDARALSALIDQYDRTRDEKVRKKVVYALSRFDAPEATQKLEEIALREPNEQIARDALFWLSQRGGKDVIDLLERVASERKNEDMQKQVLFAYAQLPNNEGVPKLINLARTHPNPEVRKQAIHWLGQSNDPRAREALLEIVQGQ